MLDVSRVSLPFAMSGCQSEQPTDTGSKASLPGLALQDAEHQPYLLCAAVIAVPAAQKVVVSHWHEVGVLCPVNGSPT